MKNATQQNNAGGLDAFITGFDPTGAVISSTYLGGTGDDVGNAIAYDGNAIVVVGATQSTNFPTLKPLQSANAGGWDVFVTSPNNFSTYFGSAGTDQAFAIAQYQQEIYIAGSTTSAGFPSRDPMQAFGGATDAFVTIMSNDGSSMRHSTFLGGSSDDHATSIVPSTLLQTMLVGGETSSSSFPTQSALQGSLGGGVDGFVSQLWTPPGITPRTIGVTPLCGVSFTATGGGSFTWSIPTNASGASINAMTGAYVAGSTGSVVDIVKVTDSVGGYATATVNVSAALSISPTSASVPPKGSVSFTAMGGGQQQTFSILTNNSGAMIVSNNYTAGSTPNVVDTVRVVDLCGASATATVNVGPDVSIAPLAPTSPPRGSIAFTASGGNVRVVASDQCLRRNDRWNGRLRCGRDRERDGRREGRRRVGERRKHQRLDWPGRYDRAEITEHRAIGLDCILRHRRKRHGLDVVDEGERIGRFDRSHERRLHGGSDAERGGHDRGERLAWKLELRNRHRGSATARDGRERPRFWNATRRGRRCGAAKSEWMQLQHTSWRRLSGVRDAHGSTGHSLEKASPVYRG